MSTLSGSPFAWLEFDKTGKLVDAGAAAAAKALIADPAITNVVVISHGWKNTKADATALYGTLWKNTLSAPGATSASHFAVLGVLWPAKAFSTDFDAVALADAAAGGVLAADPTTGGGDLNEEVFSAVVKDFLDFASADDSRAARLAADLKDVCRDEEISSTRAVRILENSTAMVGMVANEEDPELRAEADPYFGDATAQELLSTLAHPPAITIDPDVGTAQGLGNALRGLFNGPRAAVARLLNQLSYFEMKKRAGIVGAALGAVVLPQVAPVAPKRFHLVGHSFGARLVTSAAAALPAPLPSGITLRSLTLLQGAFSHNALSDAPDGTPGAFRTVPGRVSGPITITHTRNDSACSVIYAVASRLSRDNARAIGDKNDPFGSMGGNGAQRISVVTQSGVDGFAPQAGKIINLLADGFIVDHSDVTNPKCGKILAAVLKV